MVAVSNGTSVFLHTLIYMMNQSNIQQEEDTSYNYYYLDIGKSENNATKCYGIYGCFDLMPPWTSEHRPVSLFPEDLAKIEPAYAVYTRKNPSKPFYLDLNQDDIFNASPVKPHKPVFLISHGYMEGGGVEWIVKMAQELLKTEDSSVIVVDWHGGSSPPYTQAVANIRLVGAMTAHLLSELAKHTAELKLDHVHCIGHSLGAHMSGYIGYTLQKEFNLTLGRITGLDPAEPHFAKTSAPVRLDSSAAQFVDIIHTDASQFIRGGLGINERIGHVDYYPNGGTNQPGCGKSVAQYINAEEGSFFRGFKKYLGCNHIRSHEYFMESISPQKCSFLTVSCNSFDDFKAGKCFDCGKNGGKCLTFGFHSQKHYEKLLKQGLVSRKHGMVQFLKTGEKGPYCRAHYRISVKVSGSEESRLHGGEIGQLFFTMHSSIDSKGPKTTAVPLTNEGYHEPGKSYIEVVATDEIDNLKAIEVEWKFPSNLFNPLTWRILTTPKIYLEFVEISALEIKQEIKVCPKDDEALINSKPQLMLPSYC